MVRNISAKVPFPSEDAFSGEGPFGAFLNPPLDFLDRDGLVLWRIAVVMDRMLPAVVSDDTSKMTPP